ncbi:DsbA family protein [Streptomyces stramineus]
MTLFTDIWCSFAHVAVHRLHTTRRGWAWRTACGSTTGPSPGAVQQRAESSPGHGFRGRRRGAHRAGRRLAAVAGGGLEVPSSSMPALEAVQLAKEQGLAASERLDLALRRAFWAESRSIGARAVVVAVAAETEGVDAEAIAGGLDDGRARRIITRDFHCAQEHGVRCSPHLYLSDGSDHANPGVAARWHGRYGTGFPEVTANDPSVYESILRRAAGLEDPGQK